MPSTLMLIDGNSLIYRAFHALPEDIATSSGQQTNAVYGFTSMLINLMRDHEPDAMAVAFDRPEPTFRHKRVDTYKANRTSAPDTLFEQMGLAREVLDVLNIAQIELAGYEGDDLLATLATQASKKNIATLLVSGDRDMYQLVQDPFIKVVYNKRGVSDYALYDEAGILERTGVTPEKYVDYAALRGDTSDNLPGVPGVGEKTAAKLVNKYGSVAGIYDHVDEQTPKLKENLAATEELVKLNIELMQLLRDVPLEETVDSFFDQKPPDEVKLRELFEFLEFNSLYPRLLEVMNTDGVGTQTRTIDVTSVALPDTKSALEWLDGFAKSKEIAIGGSITSGLDWLTIVDLDDFASDTESEEIDGKIFEVKSLPAAILAEPQVAARVSELTRKAAVYVHEAKPLLHALGTDSLNLKLDTSLAAYLLDPAGNSYEINDLLNIKLGIEFANSEDVPAGQLDFGQTTPQAARDAVAVAILARLLQTELASQELETLNAELEMPLAAVLAKMERDGIEVDKEKLSGLNDEMIKETEALAAKIQEAAGEKFNVNSTVKLREILFEKLELTPQKKTKTGYSTDQATLEKLAGEHPIVDYLLSYREVEKLRSTYGQGLLDSVAEDGRIHATFNQTVARTGRLSSENPNLHNIPIRSKLGKRFREVFVGSQGRQLLVADYNQIELRCIAHLANDPGLVDAFKNGIDIHTVTAAKVFGVKEADVDSAQRGKAKMVSYGLAYGMEAYGLSQRLAIPISEAKEILDAYFEGFPAVEEYMQRTVTEARNRGYTQTLFGRRRAIPELLSSNRNMRLAGERQAMNAGIQGLAADIFKVALIAIDKELAANDSDAKIVLQVHDEIILEVLSDEVEQMSKLVVAKMMNAFDLKVPLEINLSSGNTWADAKS